MNPQYYVRAAPRHPDPRYAFGAFSIRPAQAELFDVAHIILLADVISTGDSTISANGGSSNTAVSHQVVVLIRQIMQQETTLPVVRRLVEALRQTNAILYTEKQGVRILVALLVKNTLYLVCVGAMSAYVMRAEKVQLLLSAERTRASYLGHSAQLHLDYQLSAIPIAFTGANSPYAYLNTDRFLLAPEDTLILSSTELPLEVIKPALFYKRQPERLATYLSKASVPPGDGRTPGVIALHWHVDRVSQTIKHLLLVLSIFFCVTATMQTVIFFNQRLDQWVSVHAATPFPRPLPPILYDATPLASFMGVAATATTTNATMVKVNVDVNVDVNADASDRSNGVATAIAPMVAIVPPTLAYPTALPATTTALSWPANSAGQSLNTPAPVWSPASPIGALATHEPANLFPPTMTVTPCPWHCYPLCRHP